MCVRVLVTQSCLTLCNPVDYSPPGSSIHGILQARILEWVAISFSRGSSQLGDRTRVSCIVGRCFNHWAEPSRDPAKPLLADKEYSSDGGSCWKDVFLSLLPPTFLHMCPGFSGPRSGDINEKMNS